MDIHSLATDYFSKLSIVQDWPNMLKSYSNMAAKKPAGWRLPQTGYHAVGGNVDSCVPAVTAVGCMQMSIILLDDMLDEDPRGMHLEIGSAAAANMASAFQAAGLQAIAESNQGEKVRLGVQMSLNKMMLMTALGQSMDVQNHENEEGY